MMMMMDAEQLTSSVLIPFVTGVGRVAGSGSWIIVAGSALVVGLQHDVIQRSYCKGALMSH